MKTSLLVGCCILLWAAAVAAGLVVKEATTVDGFMGMWSSKGTEVTYIEGDKTRSESHTDTEGMMVGMGRQTQPAITVLRFDKNLVWYIDPEDSTYMEVALEPEAENEGESEPALRVKSVEVDKTDETKTIIGHECRAVDVALTFETGNADEAMSHEMDIRLWMTPAVKELKDLRSFWEKVAARAGGMNEAIPMAEAMEDLWKEMQDIEGVPLGMEMTMAMPGMGAGQREEMTEAVKTMREFMKAQKGGAPGGAGAEDEGREPRMRMTREVISIEEKNLDDSLFEVPSGYRKVKQPQPAMPGVPGQMGR